MRSVNASFALHKGFLCDAITHSDSVSKGVRSDRVYYNSFYDRQGGGKEMKLAESNEIRLVVGFCSFGHLWISGE